MWKYNSPIGPIYIQYIPNERQYGMFFKGICWESCDSPEAEASNVFMQCTGCPEWDVFDASNTIVPNDLSQWEHS